MDRRNFIASAGVATVAPVVAFAALSPLELYQSWQEINASCDDMCDDFDETEYYRMVDTLHEIEVQIAAHPCETIRDFAIKVVTSGLCCEPPETVIDKTLIADARRVLQA